MQLATGNLLLIIWPEHSHQYIRRRTIARLRYQVAQNGLAAAILAQYKRLLIALHLEMTKAGDIQARKSIARLDTCWCQWKRLLSIGTWSFINLALMHKMWWCILRVPGLAMTIVAGLNTMNIFTWLNHVKRYIIYFSFKGRQKFS